MGIAVLGPLQVGGQPNGLSPRDRVVLSALVVRAGDPISTDSLADALWGDTPPATWTKVVQGSVMRLRKRLGVAAIESESSGYRLALSEDELDHRLFERLLERGREALAGGDPARSAYVVQEALDLWRGSTAFPDLEEWEPGRVEAARLAGLRLDAEELLVEAETASGHAPAVLERARALVAQAPFRERRWALLATALYQAGRQAEALGAVKRARAMLVDELGLDPGRELVELEQQLLRQDPSLTPRAGREVSAVCPYRGLLPYGAEDADSFFGREDDVAACLRRLRDTGVLTVVGPSGTGKSSLVRAGVVASLLRGGTPVLVTTPGARPLDSLAGLKDRGRQTLVVDQAEEAVTQCEDPAERERYFAALAAHVGAGGALVLSLRADHLGDLAPYPVIARVLEDGLYLLGPMSEPDLRRAIEGPARRSGLRLEPGLVDLLVREVEGEPAALPMLSHVLRETWERREGPTLTVDGYRATGGIRDAVSRSAESLYDAMDNSQRDRLRSLLLRLVMPTEDGDPVRARVPRSRIAGDDAHRRLVEQLVDARLVSVDGDNVQIAHEALVRVWPRLRDWLDDDVDGQRIFRHLAGAADAWDGMGRPESELYRGARLGRTLEWRDRATPDLSDTEAAFLEASVALSETELHAAEARIARERSVNRRLRAALAGAAALLVLAVAAGAVVVQTADRAERDRDRAERASARASRAADLAAARRASAQAPVHEDVATGLLLAAAALDVDSSPQAWENLGAALTRAGPLSGVADIGEAVGAPGTAWVASMAASADGAWVAASLPNMGGVRLFDATTLAPVDFGAGGSSLAVTFSPTGEQLAVAVNQWVPEGRPRVDLPIELHDLPDGGLSRRQLGGLPPDSTVEYSIDFSRDGTRIAAAVRQWDRSRTAWSPRGRAAVWDLARPAEPLFSERVPDFGTAALSPDGRLLYLLVPGVRPLRAYDVGSGRLVRSTDTAPLRKVGAQLGAPEPGDRPAGVLDVSPDGATLAVATGSRVRRFDAATLEASGPALRAHTADVSEVGYSHDGRLLVSASEDGTAIVWDAASGALLHRFVAGDALRSAAFGADDTVYTSGVDGLLQAWDVRGASRLLVLGEDASLIEQQDYRVSLPSPRGTTVARVGSGGLWFEDARTGRRTTRPVPTRDTEFTWSPDARWLLSSGDDGYLSLWNADTGAREARSRDAPGGVLAVSPDSDRVYVSSSDTMVRTLDRATLRPAFEDIDLDGQPRALLPHPADGSLIVLMQDGSFHRVQPETGDFLSSEGPGLLSPSDQTGALSPDGLLLAAPDARYNVRLLDLATGEWVGPDSQTLVGDDLVYAPDGSQFAMLQPERIRLWDGRTGEYQASLPLPSRTANLSISYLPDSTGLLIAGIDGRTWAVDTRTRRWVERACRTAGRNLTRTEWQEFFPTRPYEVTCPQWPAGT